MFARVEGDLRVWRFEGRDLPSITMTLRLAEAARAAVMRIAQARSGSPLLPSCLHGPATPGAAHRHAYWLPLDLDDDGLIDHLAVHVPVGLSDAAGALLDRLGSVDLHGWGQLAAVPTKPPSALIGPARLWLSDLPFVGPLHAHAHDPARPRPGRSAVAQLARELGRLGRALPGADIQTIDGPDAAAFLAGSRAMRLPTQPVCGWFALQFDAVVAGPLAVGFGSHFGLGLLRPRDD